MAHPFLIKQSKDLRTKTKTKLTTKGVVARLGRVMAGLGRVEGVSENGSATMKVKEALHVVSFAQQSGHRFVVTVVSAVRFKTEEGYRP